MFLGNMRRLTNALGAMVGAGTAGIACSRKGLSSCDPTESPSRFAGGQCSSLGKEHMVLTWGAGSYGQLGHGSEHDEFTAKPVEALEGKSPVEVATHGSATHSIVATSDGKVADFGNGNESRLGHGFYPRSQYVPNQAVPKFLDHIDGDVVQVAAGGFHGAAIGKGGELWTWGKASQGQLGHKDTRKGYPNRVDALSGVKIAHVACGHKHTVAVDENGVAWAWGANRDGQLGLGEDASSRSENEPRRVELLEKAGKKVVAAACGSDCTLFLTTDGEVWATGSDQDGQLGQGQPTAGLESPCRVRGLAGHKVVKLAVGDTHVMCVTSEGRVFAWGGNLSGQLGVGDRSGSAQPREVSAVEPDEVGGVGVEGIACGGAHSLVLLGDGRILAFGKGRNGQLGSGQQLQSVAAYRTEPTEVDLVPAGDEGCGRVVAVAAGAEHSMALCER